MPAETAKGPPIMGYGVPIRDAIDSGDRTVMASMLTMSRHWMSRLDDGAKGPEIDDWKAAEAELRKALGG